MNRRILTALAFTLACSIALQAQIVNVDAPATGEQYQRTDISVTLVGNWENPYRQEEAKLDMLVITPSGRTLNVPAFHVCGESGEQSRWELRFTPQETGRYCYFCKYSQPGLESVSELRTMDVTRGSGHGILHTNDNWTLRYDDGTLFRGVGENICWESRSNDDSKFFKELHEQHDRFNYPVMLPKFAQNGGNFIRVWMCSWNFPIDRKDHFNNFRYSATDAPINQSAVQRLDETVQLCEQLGIRIMLCMGPGDVRTDDSFFGDDGPKAVYRNRLRYIVARWGYSPAIAMWEFFNEIDNVVYNNRRTPLSVENVVAWHAQMSRYLKSIDPYGHIVTTSISHRDLPGLNSVPDMDINQKHIYKNTADIPGTIARYEAEFAKPYIIGEFGYEWDWSKNFDDFAGGMDSDFRRGLWQGLFNPTPVTPMSWWWEYFDNRDMVRYFQAPALVNAQMLEAGCGSFEPVPVQAGKAEAFAVKCGEKTYVYVFNTTKSALKSVKLSAKGRIMEMDIEKVQWGPASNCNGTIKTNILPGQEKVFVIE